VTIDVLHRARVLPERRSVTVELSHRQHGSTAETAWNIVRGAAALAEPLRETGRPITFGLDFRSELRPVKPEDPEAVLAWSPSGGWRSLLAPGDARSELLNLYLPICSATSRRPMTIGHLGQSLDGFIATPSGDSQFVTGDDNIVHLHRMRALSDAVVVGAGTVAADDPQLTVRHVPGPNPLRVIFDPARRLAQTYRVFTDDTGQTLYICSKGLIDAGETRLGTAAIVGVDCDDASGGVSEALRLLRSRGCARVFVEGGGVTVSAFLQANLLDRLQIAIAPVIIGDGRPAIRLAPHARLSDCRRPRYRVFRMGGDVLFDCDLRADVEPPDETGSNVPLVNQVI
jgi:diaminohydroxyphosphoribosylaminopyrimidine deaminase / 5-amino-6-(5-phosphoribosylamino)uracil reductase